MKRAAVLLLILGLGCGKASPPHPPIPIIPKETMDLRAIQRGKRVVLAWSYPAFTTTGTSLNGIEEILVYRSRETGPPLNEGIESTIETSLPYELALFEKVPGPQPAQFRKLAEKISVLDAESLPGYVMGARILFTDEPPPRSPKNEPYRYTYAVVTRGDRGVSELSNLVPIIPIDAPLSPKELTATMTAPGIVLRWEAPSKTGMNNATATPLGFNVYRLPPAGGTSEPLTPINAQPVPETTFRDTPPYGSHQYTVAAVVQGVESWIESEISDLVPVEFRDILPPPPPANVSALVEDEAVRVIWEPVQVADFAGYRVYRLQGSSKASLSPILLQEAYFVDPSPERGVEFIYGVTSVDDKGNESDTALTTSVIVSR